MVWYLPLLSQTWWKWRPPPLVRNHAKTWWGHGRHWRKNICGKPGLVRVDKMQRTIKKHVYSFKKKHTFCQRACWSAACRTKSYKIKNVLISLKKIAPPCFRDRAPPWNIRRSHSPINLKSLEASGRGGSWCRCFFRCCLFCVVGCVVCTTWWLLIHFLYLFCHTVFPLVIFFRYFLFHVIFSCPSETVPYLRHYSFQKIGFPSILICLYFRLI